MHGNDQALGKLLNIATYGPGTLTMDGTSLSGTVAGAAGVTTAVRNRDEAIVAPLPDGDRNGDFGQAEAPQPRSAAEVRQMAALLLLGAEQVYGLSPERGVGAERDRDRRVAQHLAHDLRVDPAAEEEWWRAWRERSAPRAVSWRSASRKSALAVETARMRAP